LKKEREKLPTGWEMITWYKKGEKSYATMNQYPNGLPPKIKRVIEKNMINLGGK